MSFHRFNGVDSFDLSRLQLPAHAVVAPRSRPTKLPRHRPDEQFLRGPIPLPWLQRAARLPGKTLAVALALWFMAFMQGGKATVRGRRKVFDMFGIERKATYSGLNALEKAGLISLERHIGRQPLITILPHPKADGP